MSRTLSKNPQYYQSKFAEIGKRAVALGELTSMGEREVAQCVELHQQYIDLLDDLHDTLQLPTESIEVKVDNRTIRFKNAESMAGFVTEVIHGTE